MYCICAYFALQRDIAPVWNLVLFVLFVYETVTQGRNASCTFEVFIAVSVTVGITMQCGTSLPYCFKLQMCKSSKYLCPRERKLHDAELHDNFSPHYSGDQIRSMRRTGRVMQLGRREKYRTF